MSNEQLKQLRELVAALERAPGCAWCGNKAAAYISCGFGEQAGDCCHGCMASFRRDEREFTVVAEYDSIDVANAREALSALLAERDAMKAALELARATIITGGAGGWSETLGAVNAALEPKETNHES